MVPRDNTWCNCGLQRGPHTHPKQQLPPQSLHSESFQPNHRCCFVWYPSNAANLFRMSLKASHQIPWSPSKDIDKTTIDGSETCNHSPRYFSCPFQIQRNGGNKHADFFQRNHPNVMKSFLVAALLLFMLKLFEPSPPPSFVWFGPLIREWSIYSIGISGQNRGNNAGIQKTTPRSSESSLKFNFTTHPGNRPNARLSPFINSSCSNVSLRLRTNYLAPAAKRQTKTCSSSCWEDSATPLQTEGGQSRRCSKAQCKGGGPPVWSPQRW